MRYYGIDIHKKYSVYTAVDKRGVILEQGKIPNEPQASARVMDHSGKESKAVIEATATQHDALCAISNLYGADTQCLTERLCLSRVTAIH